MTDGELSPTWRHANVRDGFTLASVGDLVLDDALAPLLEARSPGLLQLLRSADVTFGNLRATPHDAENSAPGFSRALGCCGHEDEEAKTAPSSSRPLG
nr:CapA family protein [Streptomyces sp. NBC_00886]